MQGYHVCLLPGIDGALIASGSLAAVQPAVPMQRLSYALQVSRQTFPLAIPVTDVGQTQACHWAIDELKATVPIWKKEFYEGGEVWKENAECRRPAVQQQ